MKRIILLIALLTLFCLIPQNTVQGQENTEEDIPPIELTPTPTPLPLKAEAGKDQNAVVGRTVLFDASASLVPEKAEIGYDWDFGDGKLGSGVDATHIYDTPGFYRVTLTVKIGNEESQDDLIVSVEENLIVLITDSTVKKSELQKLYEYGLTQDVLIVNVREENKDSSFIITQNLVDKLLSAQNDLKQAELIIVMTSSNIGLNALAELSQALSGEPGQTTTSEISWQQKTIIAVTSNLRGATRIAQSTFNILTPSKIVLVNEQALFPAISAGTTAELLPNLQNTGIDYQIINQYSQRTIEHINPLNFMSYGLNYLINKGIDQNTILLILSLPVIAALITMARQLIGIKAFGIYIPSIIALTFIVTSLKFGLVIFLILLITGTITRLIARRLRLLYLPRMAIVLTIVSLAILGMFTVAAVFDKRNFLSISIFPILIMTILTERFVEAQIEKGARTAAKLTIESLILSILSYYIVTWDKLESIILGYPEMIFIVIIINVILGRFTGLRLTEYLRFFNLLKQENYEQPKKDSGNE